MTTSDAILARLMELHPKVIDLSLERMHRILAALGNPQDRIPPVIHVAGTNGKGSVSAIVAHGLHLAGHSVGLYTSPHLHRFAERFRIDNAPVDDETLVHAASKLC